MIIDISEFNTVTDWEAVKRNVSLVIIRMGYRSFGSGRLTYDKKYKEHRKACEVHGIPHGFYFFPTSITEAEAKNEADWVANELEGVKDFYCPVFADSEIADTKNQSGRSDKLPKTVRTMLLKAFCDRLQSKGIPAGVYGSTFWLNNNLDMSKLPYSVWVAQYASKCDYKGNYLMWQYSSKGSVEGVSGNVDVSTYRQETEDLREKILKTATSFIGTTEYPPGSNNVVFNTHYYGRAVSGPSYPWCCAFVWDVFRMSDASDQFYGGQKTAYCPTAMNWFKIVGRFHTTPERGDVVFFDFNGSGIAGHIGFVEAVNPDGSITTIEGNTSLTSQDNGGAVMRRNRKTWMGFGRPVYNTTIDMSDYAVVKYGDKNEWVRLLQNALAVRGFPLTIDGDFGPETKQRVIEFQKYAKIPVDGVVGQLTWKALFS